MPTVGEETVIQLLNKSVLKLLFGYHAHSMSSLNIQFLHSFDEVNLTFSVCICILVHVFHVDFLTHIQRLCSFCIVLSYTHTILPVSIHLSDFSYV